MALTLFLFKVSNLGGTSKPNLEAADGSEEKLAETTQFIDEKAPSLSCKVTFRGIY